MTKTLEAVVRRRWLPAEYAVREVVAFERRFGEKHLALACHAALPLILTPELVNLIRINFLDHKDIPWIAESDLLLSLLCRPIQEGIYEVEPTIREVLLVELEDKFGWRIPFQLAEFLEFYLEKQPDWKLRPELTRTQNWIAQAYLDPDTTVREIKDRLEASLPEDNPVLGLPDQSYIPHLVEILAEPLERTNLWDEHQYLVNSTRALSKLLSGEREGLRKEIEIIGEENKNKEGELIVIAPAISQLLQDIKVETTQTNTKEFIEQSKEVEPILVGRVVILSAISVEYNAIRSHLTDIREERHLQGTVYERGKFVDNGKFWDVFICQTGSGGVNASMATVQLVNYFNPSVVLMVGIAGGIENVAIGDVVVATQVYNYESGKAQEEFIPDLNTENFSNKLINQARELGEKLDWFKRLPSNLPQQTPHVFFAPIASGEKVIASTQSNIFNRILSSNRKTVAVDMESYGVIKAVGNNPEVDVLVIRGIADLIDDHKNDSYREVAAYNASAFAFEFLAKLDLREPQRIKASKNQNQL